MGCTGSKYQALSPESQAQKKDGAGPAIANSTGSDKAAIAESSVVAEPGTPTQPTKGSGPVTPSPMPNTTLEPVTPAMPTTPSSDPGSGPARWGPGSWDPSATPDFEPPLVENVGDEDHLDMEMASENLEENFPPWKESDQARPGTNIWNKAGPGAFPAVKQASTSFDNTIIVFDWDDTLLCSTSLQRCQPNQFAELEEIVETTLLMSMSLGRTILVTNAMEPWIQETARRFMPRLLPTLERMLIVYARNKWERLYPGDTFAWKRECFRELFNDEHGKDLNLLCIGDSYSEIRAAESLVDFLGSAALIKTVKYKNLPSPADLLGELRATVPELSRLVEERRSVSKETCQDFTSSLLCDTSVFSQAISEPSWQLIDAVPGEPFLSPPGMSMAQQPWSVVP